MTKEVKAIRVAIACATVGAVVKFAFGVRTGSVAMLSSGVDSLADLFVSVVNLFVVRIANAEPDDDHNYGHTKIEGLGAMFEGGFVCAAGGFIGWEAVHRALRGEVTQQPGLGIAVMVPVSMMTFATVLYLRKIARETGSLVVKSDALHYLADVWVNLGVLASLILVRLTGVPLFDPLISQLIAGYMVASSGRIVREGFDLVMDRSLPPEEVRAIQALLQGYARIESFHDLRTRAGKIPHVDFHVVVEPSMTAREVHEVFDELEAAIRDLLGPATRIHMHADPEPPRQAPTQPEALPAS